MEFDFSLLAFVDSEAPSWSSEMDSKRVKGDSKLCHQVSSYQSMSTNTPLLGKRFQWIRRAQNLYTDGKRCRHMLKEGEVAVRCKNIKDTGNMCRLKFSQNCLMNRYNVDIHDVINLEDWKCPKCRGICDCSVCMKDRGLPPTGRKQKTTKKNCSSLDMTGGAVENVTSEKEHVVGLGSPENLTSDVGDIAPDSPFKRLYQDFVHSPNVDDIHVGALCQPSIDSKKGVAFPEGIMLTNILGIELPPQYVGHALQFLEFCSVFGGVLDVEEGEPEAVLQELVHEQNMHYKKVIQFQEKLLSFIDRNGSIELDKPEEANSWLKSMWNSIFETILDSEELELDVLRRSNDVYQNLEFSEKLRILNFVCDECLNTKEIRDYIAREYLSFHERGKEARKVLRAANKKMKNLKQELQNEQLLQDEMVTRETADLNSILRHQGVTETENKLKQAEADVIVAKDTVPKRKQRPETLRTDSIYIDSSGKKFWKLKCFSGEEAMLLQDVKPPNEANSDERWFIYGADRTRAIMGYISSSRRAKRSTTRKAACTAGPSERST